MVPCDELRLGGARDGTVLRWLTFHSRLPGSVPARNRVDWAGRVCNISHRCTWCSSNSLGRHPRHELPRECRKYLHRNRPAFRGFFGSPDVALFPAHRLDADRSNLAWIRSPVSHSPQGDAVWSGEPVLRNSPIHVAVRCVFSIASVIAHVKALSGRLAANDERTSRR
jgi:hypothetical protein